MCGRRKIDRDYPEIALHYGDMDFRLVEKIANQLPAGIVVQLHNNGESLLYPRFREAANSFKNQIKSRAVSSCSFTITTPESPRATLKG